MKSIQERFSLLLNDIVRPSKQQEKKELWNVSGILKKNSNQHLKFDVRSMFQISNGQVGKKGKITSKADKIVFETYKDWIIIDVIELHTYIKEHKLKIVQLEDLISKLEWNIILPKK